MSNLENRINNSQKIECRTTDDGSFRIEGYGIVFNKLSHDLGGFQERISPEAMEGVDLSDVYSFINHDPNLIMGRTKSGTLDIEVREDGVWFSAKAPKSAGLYVENIQRGDIDGSSFSFRVAKDGDVWEERKDGQVPLRTINKFGVVKEIGAVVSPAYPSTTAEAGLRSLEEWRSANTKEETPVVGVDEQTKMIEDELKIREKDNI